MTRRPLALWLLSLAASVTLVAQDGARARFDLALDAWDAGNYPDALARLQQVLKEPGGDTFLEQTALLTGELYRSTEISPSDRLVVGIAAAAGPRWSPDGRHFAFESAAGMRRTIHLHQLEGSAQRALAAVEGYGATFSFDGGRVAFLRTVEAGGQRLTPPAAGQTTPSGGAPSPADAGAATTLLIERSLNTGAEIPIGPMSGLTPLSVHYSTDNQLFVTATRPGSPAQPQVYRATVDPAPSPLVTSGSPPPMRVLQALAGGRLLVSVGTMAFGILVPATGEITAFEGSSYAAQDGGDAVVFLARANNQTTIRVVAVTASTPIDVKSSALPLANPAISPDGRRVAFQMMPREDWELYVMDVGSKSERRITNEIQHDHTGRFLTSDRLFGVIGESRHRRSYVYDLSTGRRARLFHNNTLRTLSMEYAWAISPDGSRVLVVADRDGDTISPERGVYLMDLSSTVGTRDVVDRLARELAAENDLRDRGRRMFTAIAPQVREVVREASVRRIYEYERDLVAFGSKYITEPGNRLAADYIHRTLASFGYEPEYQYFEVPATRTQPAIRTANVIATLRGTVHPEIEYLVSSHFDSVAAGPGADDDTSGTAALLETARILRGRPMPATIKFVWFTGEEAGLLGSREYVRQAVARGDRVAGALNNDMVGFADDHRLDDTIRYANASLRDLQHAAAFLFTNLVTYDTHYYRGTDADSYFPAWGDIFSGIGSYPILGSPHYHQAHDTLDTLSFPLITEVAKATTASIMLMASSPSRLVSVTGTAAGTRAEITWTPAAEKDVSTYLVRAWVNGQPRDTRTSSTRTTVDNLRAGGAVWVKAVNSRGLEGWDWQRAVVK